STSPHWNERAPKRWLPPRQDALEANANVAANISEELQKLQPMAPNVLAIPPQGVRVIMELAAHIPDAIRMEVGEPSFATPPHVIAAAIARLQQDGRVGYTSNAGTL